MKLIFEGGGGSAPVKITRVSPEWFCVNCRGKNMFFHTEAECFAFAEGTRLIKEDDNPWALKVKPQ